MSARSGLADPRWWRLGLRPLTLCALLGSVLAAPAIWRAILYPEFAGRHTLDTTPAAAGLAYEELTLRTADGVRLHGWFVPWPGAERALLWLHGNAYNIAGAYRSDWFVAQQRRLAAHVLIFDYRGYGLSQGQPSEEGLRLDVRAAWDTLLARPEVAGRADRVLLAGHSIGGALAVDLAASLDSPPAGLILRSPLPSLCQVVAQRLPLLGDGLAALSPDHFDALARVGGLRSPLLIVHGADDRTVPLATVQALYEAAPQPKQLVAVPGMTHNESPSAAAQMYLDTVQRFGREVAAEARRPLTPQLPLPPAGEGPFS